MTLDRWEAVFGIEEAPGVGQRRRCSIPTVPPDRTGAPTACRRTVGGVFRTPTLLESLLACAQEGQHREDAAVILVRGAELELLEDAGDVLLDRARGDDHAVGDG